MAEKAQDNQHHQLIAKLLRGGSFLGLEQIAYVFLGLLFMVMLVRHLGVAGFGTWSIAASIAATLSIGTTAYQLALERYIPEFARLGRRRPASQLLSAVLSMKLGLSLLIAAILYLLAGWFGGVFSVPEISGLLGLFSIWLVFDSLAAVGRSLLFALQEYWFRSLMTMLQGLINVVGTAVAIFSGGWLVFITVVFIVSTAVPALIQVVFGYKLVAGIAEQRHDSESPFLSRSMRYMVPLTVNQGLYTLYLHMGRLVLGYTLGTQAAGLFSFALNLLERVTALISSMSSVVLPALVQATGSGEQGLVIEVNSRTVRYLTIISIFISVGLFAYAEELTLILGGPQYAGAVAALQIMALQPLFRFPAQGISNAFLLNENTKPLMFVSASRIGLEFGLYFALMPALGVSGTALAGVCGYLAALVLLGLLVRSSGLIRWSTASRGTGRLLGLAGTVTLAIWVAAMVLGPGLVVVATKGVCLVLLVVGMIAVGIVSMAELNALARGILPTCLVRWASLTLGSGRSRRGEVTT